MMRFPSTVLATALATTMAFLGIGVIDPILPLISHELGASRAQVELLFTAYIAIMAVAMLLAGVVATRWGGRKTLLVGLGAVACCAFLCGLAQNDPELAGIRALWGFGNALFVSTALSLIGLCYSFGFFTILAYAPLALGMNPLALGWTFFGWGVLVAFSSVVLVHVLQRRVGIAALLGAVIVVLALLFVGLVIAPSKSIAIALVVLSGIPCGIANTLLTTLAIDVSPFSRSISSGAYNFLRWSGGAVAPALAGRLADTVGVRAPFAVAAAIVLVALVIVAMRGRALGGALQRNVEPDLFLAVEVV